MKTRKKRRKINMAIKLDISKTYDKLEWSFLETMMRKLGHEEKWIPKIMTCVSMVSYAILVNGQPNQVITPTRGLRQEDPISPYLYLICAEDLSSLLHNVENFTKIKGFKVAISSPIVIDFIFADDIIVFYSSTINEWLKVQKLLNIYEATTNQGINKHKSGICFSSNTSAASRSSILSLVGVLVCHSKEKYFGLPMLVGINKYHTFETIKD